MNGKPGKPGNPDGSTRDRLLAINGREQVLYLRGIGRILELNVAETLFLSQLIYWREKKDGWIYKSSREWSAETGLSRWVIDQARKKLEQMGLIEYRLQENWNVYEYKLNGEKLVGMLNELKKEENPSFPTDAGNNISSRKPSEEGGEKLEGGVKNLKGGGKKLASHTRDYNTDYNR